MEFDEFQMHESTDLFLAFDTYGRAVFSALSCVTSDKSYE